MHHHPITAAKRWSIWTCSFVLLMAACAGAIHVCGIGFSSPTIHSAAAADTASNHTFCAICNLAHSPSLAAVQFALLASNTAEDHPSALLQAHPRLTETFALYIRPPPQA
jgi:hypothetical protein